MIKPKSSFSKRGVNTSTQLKTYRFVQNGRSTALGIVVHKNLRNGFVRCIFVVVYVIWVYLKQGLSENLPVFVYTFLLQKNLHYISRKCTVIDHDN